MRRRLHLRGWILGALGLWIVAGRDHAADSTPPWSVVSSLGSGELTGIDVAPAELVLRGPDASAQLVVTGLFSNGGVWDVSRKATFVSESPAVAVVDEQGLVRPAGDGETRLTIDLRVGEGHRAILPVRVEKFAAQRPINFPNEVVPIFSKHGCNAGGCHGKSGGQNGFQLSLFGYNPAFDHTTITRDSRGRRVFPADPPHSLLLRKPTGTLPHGGGKRFEPASPDARLLERWISQGTPYGSPADPVVETIRVYPELRMLSGRARQQLRVTARFSDGHEEDVTERAQYISGSEEHLTVSASGQVSTVGAPGQGHVLVRYLGRITLFRAWIPTGADPTTFAKVASRGFIDDLVLRRLETLGIPPSEVAGDGEFLRRVSLHLTGTLPEASAARAFLEDKDPQKREKLVDRLLSSPEHASYYALKWADLLRNRRGGDQKATPITIGFHAWLRDKIEANVPLDQIVREIICAEGNVFDNPPVAWYRSLESPKLLADDTAQLFLGTRIQCARCHHHPFEKWSQEDYWMFANFFSRVTRKNDSNSREFLVYARSGQSQFTDDEPTSASFQRTYRGLRLLGAGELQEADSKDPREALADWLASPANPRFARAVVNRYWKHFFGRGIVEPEDDFRDTNPPSNPELLDALAEDFQKSGYNLRALARRITTSSTYQLSSVPRELNAGDRQNFSRHIPRRLEAEALLDAVDHVTGSATRFSGVLRGTRAIELPDESSRNYFLETFGKPDRQSACSCERSSDVNLSQIIHLLNSREVEEKLRAQDGRAASLAADPRALEARIEDLFLVTFARLPTTQEVAAAAASLASPEKDSKAPAGSDRKAWEDLLWALINTKEFLFEQ